MGAELFHLEGQTDMTKLIVAFRNFFNAPKKSCFKLLHLRSGYYRGWGDTGTGARNGVRN
jgi:hypothetical protein